MIVIRFLESLEQLTITYVGLIGPVEQDDVQINQNLIRMGQQKIKIIPEDSFQLDSESLRINLSNLSNGTWSVTMMLGAKLCKQIESSKLEEWCPPPLDDLLNDWVFCHQHEDNPMRIEEIKPKVTSSSLESISQITFLLRKQSMMSTVLFESDNKDDNLAIRIINPRIYIGLQNNLTNSSDVYEIKLQQAAAIQYKLLSKTDNLNEVKNLRHSFKVDWYIVNGSLFQQIIETIQQNNLNKFFNNQLIDEDGYLDAFI
ncbi:uncharacterized protein LOC128386336 [Panonychus citri]|uniref:uncharacterized protein LOC128386336 n=1 Tax=Panonychus citri TaxID=50023 RepID=UPI0023073A1F|nr:uncharacterized protein LOC128386336 [Panonychus citri]XP_053201333.1 uncharacterized protein LOC128386336 [Panonychus citri]